MNIPWLLSFFVVPVCLAQPTVGDAPSLVSYSPAERASFLERERSLLAIPTRASLLELHQMLADEPHVAGTPGDRRTIEEIESKFRELGSGVEGWQVKVHDFYPLLSTPVAAELSIVAPDSFALELRERGLGDAAAERARGPFAYLGYAASGDVTGEIVYANYGTKADFETLKAQGVDVRGKIILCRFGGNYRGYKVVFAQEAGAAGVIIYNDPADVGFTKGAVYPAGPWASDCCIQRGSLLVTGYQGDPLTPGVEATRDARRMSVDDAPLPKIPAQPIGYGQAAEIIKRMSGRELPSDLAEAWTGGLPHPYRLTGGEGLRVRLKIEQRREILKTSNILAVLPGSSNDPIDRERLVILGAHHDAWNDGAADPTCGTITVLEAARAYAELAKSGWRPRRTIVFACWGAEEHGIIGSSEWVEANVGVLGAKGVAYINLDMASMGPKFGAGASPELKSVIADAAAVVPQAREPGKTVIDVWRPVGETEPPIGDLGGGSDHVGFLMHAGVPSASFGSGGSEGTSYHSAYDTLRWYWKAVGDDYEPALMVTRMTIATAARLADAPVIPYEPGRDLKDFGKHLDSIAKAAQSQASQFGDALTEIQGLRQSISRRLAQSPAVSQDVAIENEIRMRSSRRFFVEEGLPGRPWFRNWFVANDQNSGYATWTLPAFRRAIENSSAQEFREAATRYRMLIEQAK